MDGENFIPENQHQEALEAHEKSRIIKKLVEKKTKLKGKDDSNQRGEAFELLGREEINQSNETESLQDTVREIIERMYEDQKYYLGLDKKVSKPDGITIVFDKDGNLEIKEIIEFKSSAHALEVSNTGDESQAKKSFETISSLVEIINHVIKGTDIDKIPTRNNLSESQKMIRSTQLILLKKQLDSLKIEKDIHLSENIIYKVVVPGDQKISESSLKNFKDKYSAEKFKFEVAYSIFKSEDIQNAISYLQ